MGSRRSATTAAFAGLLLALLILVVLPRLGNPASAGGSANGPGAAGARPIPSRALGSAGGSKPQAVPSASGRPPGGDRFAQIVAHEDDDLLFMNPDIHGAIAAGYESTTIFLTAGEGLAGVNDGRDSYTYSAQRERGMRAAYARMAGVRDEWKREVIAVGRFKVGMDALVERPGVRLIFMYIPDGGNPRANVGNSALSRLWQDVQGKSCARTWVPARSPYTGCYRHTDIVDTLAGLLKRFGPTVVRYQDQLPDPEKRGHDHGDHTMAARFAGKAVEASGDRRVTEISYMGYDNRKHPINLSPQQRATKWDIFRAYHRFDYRITRQKVVKFKSWDDRMYRRWPGAAVQLGGNAEGRLQAFAVEQGRLFTWWQRPDGGWDGPVWIQGSNPLAPAISIENSGGRWSVFARRLDTHEIVLSEQQPAGTWAWTSLGNPGPKPLRDQVGTPVAAAIQDGRRAVFVRDGKGGLAVKVQGGRGWGTWKDLGGSGVRDGLSTRSTGGGGVEVYAGGADKLLRWYGRDEEYTLDDKIQFPAVASPPVAISRQNGAVEVYYQTPDSGEFELASRTGAKASPSVSLGAGGLGRPLVVAMPQGVMVCAVGERAGLRCGLADGVAPKEWSDLGGPLVGQAALAVDAQGHAVVVAIGGHGRLQVNRQAAPGKPAFGGWHQVGN